jgi:hypothetical protein
MKHVAQRILQLEGKEEERGVVADRRDVIWITR